MESGSKWFDYTGEAKTWKGIPLKTIKRALFHKGDIVRTLTKMVINSITYDFSETALGGAVIVSPDYSAMEFISPDGLIDYTTLLNDNLGQSFDAVIAALRLSPIASWDKFAKWISNSGILEDLIDNVAIFELQTIDGTNSVVIDSPDFSGITDMASFLEVIKYATKAAHQLPLSVFSLDAAAFGWAIKITSAENENGEVSTMTLGFLFRE